MTDCIEIRGLRVLGRHGALARERDAAQPFSVDLDLFLDLGRAATTDELADTVDYGAVSEQVAGLVSTTSYALLEALAGAVADALLRDERIEAVTVRLHKLRPPIAVDVATVGVALTRRRPSSAPAGEDR
jgi:dihydroneopterin aldolase